MKVFISGPMSGYADYNRPAFMAAEKLLKDDGFDAFNPAWMDVGTEWTSKELLNIDICALSHCDAIFHIHGWERSYGAVFEDLYAHKSNIPMLMYACKKPGHTEFEWFCDSCIYIPSDGKSTIEDLKVYMFGKGKKLTLTETSIFGPSKNIWFIARDKEMMQIDIYKRR